MKYINFKRFKFSTIFKNINFRRYTFSKYLKFFEFKVTNSKKFNEYFNFIKISIRKSYRYLIKPRIDIISILRNISFLKSKFLLIHLPVATIFFSFLYLVIPTFFNYEKSDFEEALCKKKNFECIINGDIKYRFFPTPRININQIVINSFFDKKKETLATVENAAIKLSIKNLLSKDKHKYKAAELKSFDINVNIKNFKTYKNFFSKTNKFIPIYFKKGQIILSEGKDYVATIRNANLDIEFKKNSKQIELKGEFLDDDLYLILNNQNIDKIPSTDVLLKMSSLNLLAKTNFFSNVEDSNLFSGNILIKKDKNRFTGIFDYKNNELKIKKSNLKNSFLEGEIKGKLVFIPYFNFELDLDMYRMNFTKLYNYFLTLDEKKQKKLFKINNKINGKLNMSSDKIYSNYNLIKSFESRLALNNGNIMVEQFLINLGKLGAADLVGTINNDKKFTNFSYESNIFVDNQRKFISKFGIYNRKEIPANLFISGNFDFENIRASFYEISDNEKLNNDDVNFIEKELNDFMLSDGYVGLFNFSKFKEFIKSITSDIN
tara:strand:- start:1618 stop:3261 length:1644 start_codon:yes stop_codon:yes gene_type:complete